MAARILPIDALPETVSDAEALSELALSLYSQGRVSLGKAAEVARMGVGDFMKLASGRGIPTCGYEPGDLERELEFLRRHFG